MPVHPEVKPPGLTPDRIVAFCIGSYLMRRNSPELDKLWQARLVGVLRRLSDGYIRVIVIGASNLPEPFQPTLFAPVPHVSHIDHTAVVRATGQPLSMLGIGAASDYFSDKPEIAYFFEKVLCTIPINRDNSGAGLGECGKVLKSGRSLLLYPEGGREKNGRPFDLYDGTFYLAIRNRVRLSPTIIRGAQHVLPAGAWIPRPGIIEVEFLPPFLPGDYKYPSLKQGVPELHNAFLDRVSPYWRPPTPRDPTA